MAVGDLVIVAFGSSQALSTFAPAGPLLGRITAEDAGPPITADVQWFNGKKTDGVDRNNTLLKLIAAEEFNGDEIGALVGQWIQLVNYPTLADGTTPKSKAASGVVKNAFFLTDDFVNDPPNTRTPFVTMSMYEGRIKFMVPVFNSQDPASSVFNQILKQPGRRNILASG